MRWLILDHVAEARDLLLRLAGCLIIQRLGLRLRVASEFVHLLLHPTAHFAGGALEIRSCGTSMEEAR